MIKLMNIFNKPEKVVANQQSIITETEKISFRTFFVATAKEMENEIHWDEVFFHKINYIAEHERTFSQYKKSAMDLYNSLLLEEPLLEYPSLILGYYDKENENVVVEGFIKDFNKLDSLDVIDYYFTMKSEETYYSKAFFEKEYTMLFNEIVSKNLLDCDVTYASFDAFLYSFHELRKSMPIDVSRKMESERIKDMLSMVFSNVKDVKQQISLTMALVNIGFIEQRYAFENGRIINPMKEDYKNELIRERYYKISDRVKEIYRD